MSKSIKLKNDVFLSTKNLAFNAELELHDGESGSIPVYNGEVYIFMNTHIFQRCILLITVYSNGNILNIDTIFKSSDDAVPNISLSGNRLTISMTTHARGYIFRLTKLKCA